MSAGLLQRLTMCGRMDSAGWHGAHPRWRHVTQIRGNLVPFWGFKNRPSESRIKLDDNRCLNECDELLTDRQSDGGDVAYLRRKKKKKKCQKKKQDCTSSLKPSPFSPLFILHSVVHVQSWAVAAIWWFGCISSSWENQCAWLTNLCVVLRRWSGWRAAWWSRPATAPTPLCLDTTHITATRWLSEEQRWFYRASWTYPSSPPSRRCKYSPSCSSGSLRHRKHKTQHEEPAGQLQETQRHSTDLQLTSTHLIIWRRI